jgi:hypothetical protein
MGIGLPPRLARDPSAMPPFRKFISGFALASRNNMTAIFETARMYAGGSPDLPLRRLFGVTSFELG